MQVHGRLPTSIMQHTCHSFTVLWYPFTLVDGLRQCGSQVYCPTPQDLYMYPVLLVKSWSAQGPVVKGWIILSNRWYVTMWLSVNWTNWAINWIAFSPVEKTSLSSWEKKKFQVFSLGVKAMTFCWPVH